MRIDKWLWAARFFKTRQLAVKAIRTGKIAIQGQTISKPAANIDLGHLVSIKRGFHAMEVEVKALSEQRGPAIQARMLYEETKESADRREALAAQMKAQPKVDMDRRKPDKRGVREHLAWKRHID